MHGPSGRPIDVLLVEDNEGFARLTELAFAEADVEVALDHVTNGEDALDYLRQRGEHGDASCPELVMLDLNLPGMPGIEVLETIKTSRELKHLPVIVLTGSDAPEDVNASYRNYANTYVNKPVELEDYVELVETFGEYWDDRAELPTA